LPLQNVPTNGPVKQHEVPVDSERGPHLGGVDALLNQCLPKKRHILAAIEVV
jgi:hypothetical protein